MKTMRISQLFLLQSVLTVIISIIAVSVYSLSEYRTNFVRQSALAKLDADRKAARRYLLYYFEKLELKDGILVDGRGQDISSRNDFVDAVSADLGDAATVFVVDGDDYRRVITSVMKDDGTRAVGTMLGKGSAAYNPVRQGRLFQGEADILGRPFLTVYDPLTDAAGNVIGIMYVGIPRSYLDEGERSFFGKFVARTAAAALIIILLSVAVNLLLFRRMLSRPLAAVRDYLHRVGSGELAAEITPARDDEIGALVVALARTVDDFRSMVQGISENSSLLGEAIEGISTQNGELALRTTEQAASIEEMAAAIEETTATIRANSDSAEDARRFSVNAGTMAHDGSRVAGEASGAIAEIGASGKRINEILTMINELSFQTNLLALNAAIEAARAGEHGRGFAVVAGEVRNLSQRSAAASKEIGLLVDDVLGKIDRGTGLVETSSTTLNDIASIVGQMESMITDISRASVEQKDGMEQINGIVEGLDAATQKNAYMVKDITTASEALVRMSEEMSTLVRRFSV